jgi:hypothetical protein
MPKGWEKFGQKHTATLAGLEPPRVLFLTGRVHAWAIGNGSQGRTITVRLPFRGRGAGSPLVAAEIAGRLPRIGGLDCARPD